jgi:hypothetical protein
MQAFDADALMSPVADGLTGATTLASRPDSLTGMKVALLGNLKPNCDVLLRTLEGKAIELGAARTMFREKASCSLGAGDALLDEIAQNCQVAVVALGD